MSTEGTTPNAPLTELNAPEGPISDTGPEFNTFNADAGSIQLEQVPPEALRERTPVEAAAVALLTALWAGETRESYEHLAVDLQEALIREEALRIATPPLLEVTGNIEERELAARFMEAKAAGARAISKKNANLSELYDLVATTYLASAQDFRSKLHLPQTMIEGRVIPYNESNDIGLKHEMALRTFFADVHERNVKAGWWNDLETGQPKKRNLGELLILFVTEIVEAYDAACDDAPDDKLPEFPGFGVELGDLFIRAADLAGTAMAGRVTMPGVNDNPGNKLFRQICHIARDYEMIRKTPESVGDPEFPGHLMPPMDIAQMIDAKLAFNASRPDHKLENRLKEDGKKT